MNQEIKKFGPNFKDITGKKFGKLLVLEFAYIGSDNSGGVSKTEKRARWKCKCDCGKEVIASGKSLRLGIKQSCGCLHLEACLEKNTKEPGHSTWTAIYSNYRYNSNKEKIPFEITLEQFKEICNQNCYYCDKPPILRKVSNRCKQEKSMKRREIYANGIDRIDSDKSIGYVKENLVSACWEHNKMKNNMSQLEFFNSVNILYHKFIEKGFLNKNSSLVYSQKERKW